MYILDNFLRTAFITSKPFRGSKNKSFTANSAKTGSKRLE